MVLKRLVAAAIVFGVPASLSAQSVNAGIDAWQKADYATAVAIWRPLAEKGNPDAEFNRNIEHFRIVASQLLADFEGVQVGGFGFRQTLRCAEQVAEVVVSSSQFILIEGDVGMGICQALEGF